MSNAQGAPLFRSRPAVTTNVDAFTAVVPTEITRLAVVNLTGSAATYRLFHVPSGVVLADDHAIRYDVSVAAGGFSEVVTTGPNGGVHLAEGDKLYVRSATASALTFIGYGVSANIAPRS